MKKILFAALSVVFLALTAAGAFAEEAWNPHLKGVDEGTAMGVLPPKGVYFVNNIYATQDDGYDSGGNKTTSRLDALIDVPVVVWNPGFKVRGADYAVAVAQPFSYLSLYSSSSETMGNGHVGLYNTVVVPAILSWALPNDLHLKTSLGTYVNDPSSSNAHPVPNGGAGSGNSFWTIEPSVALSWLHNGWNASGELMYEWNLKDTSTDYQSGNEIEADYSVTKTVNKWTGGLGAYQVNQLENDKLHGATVSGTIRNEYGLGPIVGYDFGPVNLQMNYNWALKTTSDFGGNNFNLRFVCPL